MRQEYQTEVQSMGTQVTLVVVEDRHPGAARELADKVERLFAAEESRFSRFIDSSELSQLIARGGTDDPSPQMWDVLRRAEVRWKRSGGLFDPTVLSVLERLGYDRTFADVRPSDLKNEMGRRNRNLKSGLSAFGLSTTRDGGASG